MQRTPINKCHRNQNKIRRKIDATQMLRILKFDCMLCNINLNERYSKFQFKFYSLRIVMTLQKKRNMSTKGELKMDVEMEGLRSINDYTKTASFMSNIK